QPQGFFPAADAIFRLSGKDEGIRNQESGIRSQSEMSTLPPDPATGSPSDSAFRTPHSELWNVPNLLSFARIPMAVGVFACIVYEAWLIGLVLFVIACATDWLDGWWARKYGPLTLIGRNLDPLADKILVCGAFIYLIPVPHAGLTPWMVTVVVVRELLVTGIRGMVEATGKKFGADWFGKLKMGLQCAVLIGVLLIAWLRTLPNTTSVLSFLDPIQLVLLWAMLAATVGSGAQYIVKAAKMLR
ncbi:MAG: CDP-alcohol phosphatidyltransferase family protein, partial [Planctomycetia bacterium]|nr:CDP-alcohol phosphatidyltransferase family protein [Planctomycetia bacterium]